jgi:hypothetical protein
MRQLLLLLCAATFFVSCENIEDNTSAFQGDIDGTFFQATAASGAKNLDRTYTFTGLNAEEKLELTVSQIGAGIYELGPNSENKAVFTDASGGVYSTDFSGGEGEIVVTRYDTAGPTQTGTFTFTAVRPGIDTIRVSRGLFFEVYFDNTMPSTDDEDPVDPTNAGTFVAEIDDQVFNTQIVSANSNSTNITITGVASGRSLSLKMPIDTTTGNFSLDQNYQASYIEGSDVEAASSGTIVITAHNTTNKTIKGAFAFETQNHSITLGQFNVTYQ